jgi:hypothetical protein
MNWWGEVTLPSVALGLHWGLVGQEVLREDNAEEIACFSA